MGIYAHVSLYEQKCCQCFRILWEVPSMFHDMVSKAVHVSGYGGSDVNAGSAADVTAYCEKCCKCFKI